MDTQKTAKLDSVPENSTIIGRGVIDWRGQERVSDRYGTVTLFLDDGTDSQAPMNFPPEDERGTLIARVVDARKSQHFGDMFRGIFPRKPANGDIIVLGYGTAFTEVSQDNVEYVGVQPIDDDREEDWLNPRALYDCHGSVVELIWKPD